MKSNLLILFYLSSILFKLVLFKEKEKFNLTVFKFFSIILYVPSNSPQFCNIHEYRFLH